MFEINHPPRRRRAATCAPTILLKHNVTRNDVKIWRGLGITRAPACIRDHSLSLFYSSPPLLPLTFFPHTSPLIGNKFWQFRRGRLNTMGGVTAGIKNKMKGERGAMAGFMTTFFLALRRTPRGKIPRPAFLEGDFVSSDSKENKLRQRPAPSRVNDRPHDKASPIVPHFNILLFSSHDIFPTNKVLCMNYEKMARC